MATAKLILMDGTSTPQAQPAGGGGAQPAASALKLRIRDVDFYYGAKKVLHSVSLDVPPNKITALIGPSGCGKSTFLRTLNRMYETVPHARAEGDLRLDGEDILTMDVTALRRRVGMVFQRPNPFPKSIFDNIAYGLRVNGSHRQRARPFCLPRLAPPSVGGRTGAAGLRPHCEHRLAHHPFVRVSIVPVGVRCIGDDISGNVCAFILDFGFGFWILD